MTGAVFNFTGNYDCTVTKHSSDYNKDATIIGKFEQIRSDDLVLVEASNNSGEAITAATEDIPFSNTIRDVNNLWSNIGNTGLNTNDTFTVPKTANYDFDISTRTTGSIQRELYLTVNGVNTHFRTVNSAYIIQSYMFLAIPLVEGDTVTFRSSVAMTLTNDINWHRLRIVQRADKESIVANLMETQVTKCQTKYLSADVSSIGIMSDLSFNNLTIGRKYLLRGQFSSQASSHRIVNDSVSGGVLVGFNFTTDPSVQSFSSGSFSATSTSVVVTSETTNITFASGDKGNTYMELCELPETVIETTEFD